MLTIRKRGKYFHVRGTIRVGQEKRIVKEHSCGTDRRDDAEAYRSKLETEVRHEILHGRGGRTHTMTIADAGMRYMERPGGVRSYDLWRLGQINNAVGDYSIAEVADAWSQFKRVRCGGLSPATVQRFRATFSAAINYLAAELGFDVPKLPRGEKVSNKRVRYLVDEQADRLVAAYAARPAHRHHASLAGPSHRRSAARQLDARQLENQLDLRAGEQERRTAHRDDASQDTSGTAPAVGFTVVTDRGTGLPDQSRRTLSRSARL